MTSHRRVLLLLSSSLIVCLIALLICLSAFFLIPRYVESELLPQTAHLLGIENFAGKVRYIGPTHADLGSLVIGDQDRPAFAALSIQIDYSPQGLLQKHLRRILISGIELYLEYTDGQLQLRGLPLDDLVARLRAQSDTDDAALASGTLAVDRIEIRNATIIGRVEDVAIRIPLEIDLHPAGGQWQAALRFFPRDQAILISAAVDLEGQQLRFQVDAQSIQLGRFADLLQLLPQASLAGQVDISAVGVVQMKPWALSEMAASVALQGTQLDVGEVQLVNARAADGTEIPLRLEISLAQNMTWNIYLAAVSLQSPLALDVLGTNATLSLSEQGLTGGGQFTLAWHRLPGSLGSQALVTSPLVAPSKLEAHYHRNRSWRLMISSNDESAPTPAEAHFELPHMVMSMAPPQFVIEGSSDSQGAVFTADINVPALTIAMPAAQWHLPDIQISANTRINDADQLPRLNGTFETLATEVAMTTGGLEGRLSKVLLAGEFTGADLSSLSAQGLFQVHDGSFSAEQQAIEAVGLAAELPLLWPLSAHEQRGSFQVETLKLQELSIGSITGQMRQETLGVEFSGKHISHIVKGADVNFTGRAAFGTNGPNASFSFEMPVHRLSPPLDLGSFATAAKGTTLAGDISLQGHGLVSKLGFHASARCQLALGRLSQPQRKVRIENIQGTLLLPDLPNIRSAPRQVLQFQSAHYGDITVASGTIDFQIESPRSLLIEKSAFKWCGGNVETHALRIRPDTDHHTLVLYCDRLKLVQILEQFGTLNAEGEGTVNGRIPVEIGRGRIKFADGFLYSTPGEGGKIRMTGTDVILAGIPVNTPQFAQLDLAREALKDYDYQWTKLNLQTEGDDLLMRMQLDGKPSQPLPFVYEKEFGGFVRVDGSGRLSNFQGIRLDVNFRFPLDQILHYGKSLQDFF